MASIAQLVSEIAHSVRQPNNKVLRENLKMLIIQTRNEIIRRSYENHNYIDKGLTQRYRVSLISVNDGDIELPDGVEILSSYAFSYCPSLTSVSLPSTLKKMGSHCFYGCSSLTNIVIPEGVSEVPQ